MKALLPFQATSTSIIALPDVSLISTPSRYTHITFVLDKSFDLIESSLLRVGVRESRDRVSGISNVNFISLA